MIGKSTQSSTSVEIASTMAPANREVVTNLSAMMALAANKQNGVIDLRENDGPIELYDKPKSTLVTTKGRNAADNANAATTAYVFNTDTFKTSIITADGEAALASTYNDGFSGKNIQRHILCANMGRGLKIKQITFTAYNSAGNQDLTVLEAMEFTIQTYTAIGGREKPKVLDISEAIRNTQNQSGVLTLLIEGWVSGVTQLSWKVTSGATITANISWE